MHGLMQDQPLLISSLIAMVPVGIGDERRDEQRLVLHQPVHGRPPKASIPVAAGHCRGAPSTNYRIAGAKASRPAGRAPATPSATGCYSRDPPRTAPAGAKACESRAKPRGCAT